MKKFSWRILLFFLKSLFIPRDKFKKFYNKNNFIFFSTDEVFLVRKIFSTFTQLITEVFKFSPRKFSVGGEDIISKLFKTFKNWRGKI